MATDRKAQMQARLDELKQVQADQLAQLERTETVLLQLPPEGATPIVCNFRTPNPCDPRAWVVYQHDAYAIGEPEPVQRLKNLEALGWSLLPQASLVKWDNYRAHLDPGTPEEIQTLPENERGGTYHKLTSVAVLAAYWVRPHQHTKTEFACFMRAPDGLTYQVLIEAPELGCSISARRVVTGDQAGWRFVPGSGQLHTPAHWITAPGSHCAVETDQGLNGAVYFPAADSKATASEALASLLKK